MFVDIAKIKIKAGNGGDGAVPVPKQKCRRKGAEYHAAYSHNRIHLQPENGAHRVKKLGKLTNQHHKHRHNSRYRNKHCLLVSSRFLKHLCRHRYCNAYAHGL